MQDSPASRNKNERNNVVIPLTFKTHKTLISNQDTSLKADHVNTQINNNAHLEKPTPGLSQFLKNIYNNITFDIVVNSTKLKNIDEPPSHCLFKTHNYTISISPQLNDSIQSQGPELQRYIATATLRSSSNYIQPLGYSFQHNFMKLCMELVISFQSSSFARNTEFFLWIDVYVDEMDGSNKLTKIISLESDTFYVYSKPDVYVKQVKGSASTKKKKKKKGKDSNYTNGMSTSTNSLSSTLNPSIDRGTFESIDDDTVGILSTPPRKRTRAPSNESSSFDEPLSQESSISLLGTPPSKRRKPSSQTISIASIDSDALRSPPTSQNFNALTYTDIGSPSSPNAFLPSPPLQHGSPPTNHISLSQESSAIDVTYFQDKHIKSSKEDNHFKPLKKRFI